METYTSTASRPNHATWRAIAYIVQMLLSYNFALDIIGRSRYRRRRAEQIMLQDRYLIKIYK